jgi:LPXTG-site transpeptidase (sortase) family protein
MIRSVRSFLTASLLALSLLVVQVSPVQAASLPAEINKQFTPLQIDAGGVSVMRVTIFNPNTFQLTDADWTDNLISVQPGLYIANPAGVVNTCGGMVIATPGGTTLSLGGALANDGGTVPAQVGSTPGECYVEVNVSSVTPGNLINTIPASNLDAQGNDSGTSVDITNTTPASATITVTQVLNPSLSKLFVPSTIFVGENSQLTIRLNNNDSDTSLTGASYTDTLPAGLQIATPNGLTVTNCGSGTATAPAGGTVISLSAATVTPAQDCLVQVNVTGASGAYLIANSTANTIPAGPGGPGSLQTNQGVTNITPAQGEITIQPISVQKAFAPDPVDAGDTSILTITLENPTGAAYTGVAINDDLTTMGAGFTIGGAPTANTCGFTVNAPVAGTLIQLTGGTIPASATPPTPRGTCIFSIPVQASLTSTGGTSSNNTIPANTLTATQPVTNFLPATDNLTVNRALVGTKAYSPTSMLLGGTSQVTITLTNRSSTPITGVNFTDTLAPNLTVSGTPLTPQCGGAISNAANSVTLTGGTIPANGNCTIVFNVTSSTAGTYDNAVAANSITNTQGIGHAAFSTNPDLVVVNSGSLPVGLTKTFQTDPIVLGQFSRLRIRITAPVDTFISGINITDNLPAGLVIAPYPPAIAPTDTCPGGTLTAVAGTSVITFTNTTAVADRLAAGTFCDIDVRVTSTTPGLYTNTIPVGAGGITTFEGRSNITPATDTITVTGMTTSKAFYPAYVQAGGRSTVTLTLFNTSSVPMTNVSVTDTMPGTATDGIRLAAVPNAITTCGGTLTAAPGSNIVTLTGGTILAGSIATPSLCTITFDVVGLDSTPGTPSTQTNTLVRTDVDALIGSTGVATEPFADSSATLNIQDLSMGVVKGFNPVLVYGGAYSTMSVELINPNLNAPLTGIAFTDDMTLLGTGMRLANPVTFDVGTCGGVLTGNPGDTSFSFSGGSLAPTTTCTLTLRVVMTVNGNLTNRIPAGTVTTFNGVSNPDPTEASLTNLPGVSVIKSFSPAQVLTNQPSTLTIVVSNTSNVPVVGMGVADNLPGTLPDGLEVANPANETNTCGGTLTAIPGAQTIQLVGGGLTAVGTPGAICTLTVDVISTRPGVYVNTIPAGSIVSVGGVTNNDPTTDTLTVTSNYSLGNRVWYDTNNNGAIDFGTEIGIPNVRVQLFNVAGTEINVGPDGILGNGDDAPGGMLTNATGYYRFDNLPAGDYTVRIPNDNFSVGGTTDALVGYWSSGTTIDASGVPSDATANDPDTDVDDSDENGITTLSGNATNFVASAVVTLGPGSFEPLNESDLSGGQGAADGYANMTVDFGFYRQTLGDLVFVDTNGDGDYDAGTDGLLSGATVQLYSSNGTEIITGADGIRGTADDGFGPDGISGNGDDGTGGMLTNAGGNYLFGGLPQGDYIVRVTPPVGYSSTVDTSAPADTTDPDTNADNNDNGSGTATGQVSSGIVTLTPGQGTGGSAGAANNIVTQSIGTTSDPTVDFGFTASNYSLGNRVWYDTNNNGAIDFGTEAGIPNVRVQLFNSASTEINVGPDGVLGTGDDAPGGMLTNANGYYRFDNLPAGDYTVRIPNDNFSAGGTTDALVGYWSSGTTIDASGVPSDSTANDPDSDVDDSDENGITTLSGNATNFVASAVVTLGPGSVEPLNENDLSGGQGATDGFADMTVDFGFYRQTLGDLVFVDNNGDGTYDAGDTPLQNAVVQLYSSNGTEINVGPDGIFGTSDDAAGGVTTSVGGTYQFSGLPQGDYIVRVTPPVGYTSTVDTADSADTTDPDTNTDNNDNGGGTGIGQASSGILTLTPGQGTGGSAGAANNIVTQITGSTSDPTVDFGFVTNNAAVTKNIIGTNETFTSGTDVAIGEIVTYEVVVNLPIGTPLTNVTVTDRMDKGLAFVECILVEVAGVNQTPIVCPAPPPIPPAQPVVSSITNPGDFPGNPANPGRQVVFTIGNIPAQTGATTLRIQYRAIVLNVLENQDNVTLNNSATWAFTGGSFTASAPNVRIIEPDLAIDKSATPSIDVALGTPIQFSLTINHTVLSSVDAFDVVVTDILPPELEYIPCSITYTGLAPTTPPAPAYCPGATSNLIFEWDVFPLGATATITFNARLVNAPAANTANVAWTSLPIDPGPGGLPVQLSPHNTESTERWYDPLDDVNIYAVFDTVTINAPPTGGTTTDDEDASIPNILPKTGFAPNRFTALPEQPAEKMYSNTDVWLEVPRLGLTMPIVGVPIVGEDWDVSWLWNEAGWLEGTAFPSWQGNSVLTSHVTLSNGEEGPFAKLGELKYGDRIIVHAYGESFIYEVRQNRTVKPGNTSVLQHEDKAWLTLLTCKTYNEAKDTYADRIAVRAVLIGSAEDKTSSRTNIR